MSLMSILTSFIRLSTFYHFIANINIGDEKETINSKNKFNKDKKTGLDDPDNYEQQARYKGSIKQQFNPNGDPYDSDEKSVISARVSFMSRTSERRTRLTLRFDDESLPSDDG